MKNNHLLMAPVITRSVNGKTQNQCIFSLFFLMCLILKCNFGVSQNRIAFNCDADPIQTSTPRCEGFTDYPEIRGCEPLPTCGPNEDLNYCWFVKKPTNLNFSPVSGNGTSSTYETLEDDFKVNGNTISGNFIFKRVYYCSGNCPQPDAMNSSNEVTISVTGFQPANNTTSTDAMCGNGSTRMLTGTPSNGTWSLISGPGAINFSNNSYEASGSGNAIIRYTIPANGPCPISFDDVAISVTGFQPANNTTSTDAMCGNGSTRMLTGTPSNGTWSLFSGPGSINFSNNSYEASGSGNAIIRYTIPANGPCPISFDDVAISVTGFQPANNTTSTDAMCGNGSTRMLTGTPPNGSWSITGPGSINGNIYTASGSGNAIIRYTIPANGPCPISFDNDTISVTGFQPAHNTTSTNAMCGNGSTRILTGTPPNGSWSITGPGSINGNIYTASGSGNAIIRYTIPANGPCPISFDNDTISIKEFQNATIISDEEDMCGNGSIRELTGTPEGGEWSLIGPGYMIGNTYTASGSGNVNISYTIPSNGPCPESKKDISWEVKNVPIIKCKVSETTNKGERIFTINQGSENLFYDSINYQVKKFNGEIILNETRNNLDPISEFFPSGSLKLYFTIYYKNGCLFSDSLEFIVNDENCDNFKSKIKINDIPTNYNNYKINHYSCNQSENIIAFEFERLNNNLVSITYKNKVFGLSNNIISIIDTFRINSNSTNSFEVSFDIRSGVAGNFQNNNCKYVIELSNLPLPKLTLDKDSFCFKNDIDLRLRCNVDEISVFLGETEVTTKKDSFGFFHKIILNNISNNDQTYKLLINKLKYKNNNVCPESKDSFLYTILRSPEIKLISDLCKDDSIKSLLNIDPKDINARFTIKNGEMELEREISGNKLKSSSLVSVNAELQHGSLTCPNNITGTVNVNNLPLAAIEQYQNGCGPFYQIKNFNERGQTIFNWKVQNDNTLVKITDDIFAFSGTGDLILEAEEKKCYNRDTIRIDNSSFKFSEMDNITTRRCGGSTLYFNSTGLEGFSCYRWLYIDEDGGIKTVSGTSAPWFSQRNGIKPLLIKSADCNNCKDGTIVYRTNEIIEDCDDKGSMSNNSDWRVLPVPAIDLIDITSDYFIKGRHEFVILDAFGRNMEIVTIEHPGGLLRFSFQVSAFPSGMYYIKNNRSVKKFIVIKD